MKGRNIAALLSLGGVVLVAALPATAQTPMPKSAAPAAASSLSAAEQQFILDVDRGNAHELKLAQMARDKAQRNEVRELATRIAQHHTKASQELRQLAAKKNVNLAQTASGQPDPQLEWMSKVSPAQFGQEFVKAMVKKHEKGVADFRKMSQEAKDPDVRAWAAKMVPRWRNTSAWPSASRPSLARGPLSRNAKDRRAAGAPIQAPRPLRVRAARRGLWGPGAWLPARTRATPSR